MNSYQILYEESHYDLTEKVRKLIKAGWRPQGGVSVQTVVGYRQSWAQAMVK